MCKAAAWRAAGLTPWWAGGFSAGVEFQRIVMPRVFNLRVSPSPRLRGRLFG